MPKKLRTIPILTILSISTLGSLVPMSAYATEYYHVSEITDVHAKYKEAMSRCEEYSDNFALQNCYTDTKNEFKNKYGGLFKAMTVLDSSDRMMVSALNPTAGTARFYVSETNGEGKTIFTFENLVVFWADGRATPSPYWDDEAAWQFVDTVINDNPIPEGFHVLYKGKRGEENWMTANAENRVIFNDDDDRDFITYGGPNYFFVMGYDTAGNRHMQRSTYWGCTSEDFSTGGECRLQYEYSAEYQVAAYSYAKSEATAEDAILADLKMAIKIAKEAEATAKEAEAAAREAERAAREAETIAREAEENAREAEIVAMEAEAAAREAEAAAREAEAAAREAENTAKEAEAATKATEAELNRVAKEAEAAAKEASQIAKEAALVAEEKAKISDEAIKNSKESAAKIAEIQVKIAELTSKIADFKPYTISSPAYYTKTVEKIVEKNPQPEVKTNDLVESVEVPASGEINNYQETDHEFPWWIIVFIFSGIAITLWWFIPTKKFEKSVDK